MGARGSTCLPLLLSKKESVHDPFVLASRPLWRALCWQHEPLFTPGVCSWHGTHIKLSPITSHTLHPGFDNPVIFNFLSPYSQSVGRFCLLLTFDHSV